jgi:hypothetical protein
MNRTICRDANFAAAWNSGAPFSIDDSEHGGALAMFWVYWDTAWSIVFGGIMFTTIVTHPDAEFIEVRQQSRIYPRRRDL